MRTVIRLLPSFRHRLCCGLCGILLLLLPAGLAIASAPDQAPRLISTTGGGAASSWDSLQALEKAAARGNPEACFQLGVRFETGDGVKPDAARARQLYEKAAKGGSAMALYRIGRFYLNGIGVDRDPDLAARCYRIAALANVPVAQYNLGAMLVSARGVPRDFVDGLAWLILAAHNQFSPQGEKTVRAHLAGQPQVIAAAEKRAKELRKEIASHHGPKPTWPLPAENTAVAPESPPPIPPPVEKPSFAPPAFAPPKAPTVPPPTFSPPTLPAPSLPPAAPATTTPGATSGK